MPANYRGPRVANRGGTPGSGRWIWVFPADPHQVTESVEGPDVVERPTIEDPLQQYRDGVRPERELALAALDAEVERALEAAGHEDARPGYGAFYFDPDDHPELDEFAYEIDLEPTKSGTESTSPGSIRVSVLGPVMVTGWLTQPKRKVLTELVCYLALHAGRPLGGDELRAALGGHNDGAELSVKSLRTYMSELRRCLGPGLVPIGQGTGYAISGDVVTDWSQFQTHLSSATDADGDRASHLRDALELVRGRPFAGTDYRWVYAEFLASEMEVAISSAARQLAQLSEDCGDHRTTLFAYRRGLLASPFDFSLWEGALRAAAQLGADEVTRTKRDAQAALGDDAIELEGFR
jgi:DNA-binding SARP family transcriptional activator